MLRDRAEHGRGHLGAEAQGAISCDVLDAWFEPSPRVYEAIAEPSLVRMSPDLELSRLAKAISSVRGVPTNSLSFGAGSSEIIHRVLPRLAEGAPVLLTDPIYSEYSFLFPEARRVTLSAENGFRLDLDEFVARSQGCSVAILVNAQNPTGTFLTRDEILALRARMDPRTWLWVDEAYVDFAPGEISVETDAARSPNIMVLKSLSKAYALSGLRAAYLVAPAEASRGIKAACPPWIIGTPAQAAACAALLDETYYQPFWSATTNLAARFAAALRDAGLEARSGVIGAVLVRVPRGLRAEPWACALAERGVFVRTPLGMGRTLGEDWIRVSLREECLWPRIVAALRATSELPR